MVIGLFWDLYLLVDKIMSPNGIISVFILFFLLRHCAADLCNWSGSGLHRGEDSRTVLQVRLRCTEGSVEWVYPGQALRVVLQPNLSYEQHTTVCIKPFRSFRGASVYIERAGELELLLTDGGRPEQVFCFRSDGPQRPAIYLQANPQNTVSQRTLGFRYELLGNRSSAPNLGGQSVLQTACRPCNDSELLLAVCSSDFVVRGYISNISHDPERQTSSVQVSGGRVYRQRSGVFEREEEGARQMSGSDSPWRGHIHTLLRCGARPGVGEFLFTGSEHFGEAWLGCAPRYKDFLALYRTARAAHLNSCDFPLD